MAVEKIEDDDDLVGIKSELNSGVDK